MLITTFAAAGIAVTNIVAASSALYFSIEAVRDLLTKTNPYGENLGGGSKSSGASDYGGYGVQ